MSPYANRARSHRNRSSHGPVYPMTLKCAPSVTVSTFILESSDARVCHKPTKWSTNA